MPGTFNNLQSGIGSLTTTLSAMQHARGADVRTQACNAFRALSLCSIDDKDTLFRALRKARIGSLKAPSLAVNDDDLIDFLIQRYPHLSRYDDLESRSRWYGIVLMQLKQLLACQSVLLASVPLGKTVNQDVMTASEDLVVRPRLDFSNKELRKQETDTLKKIVKDVHPRVAEIANVDGTIGTDAEIDTMLSAEGSGLQVLARRFEGDPTKGVKGFVGAKEIPLATPDPEWKDEICVGGTTIKHPAFRSWLRLPSVAITRYANDSEWPNSAPVRAMECLLAAFPSHIMELRLKPWSKKK